MGNYIEGSGRKENLSKLVQSSIRERDTGSS
jgi:hypothetical protein